MAFDQHEITSLYYSRYEISAGPSCPNGADVWEQTISRVMTWSDLMSDCETIKLGITYNPNFPDGHFFYNGEYNDHNRSVLSFLADHSI
jgi:hypothetical protein